jgi:hypothetical protein
VTFWAFLSQTLSPSGSCREAVRKALAYLASSGRTGSSATSAYCQARGRLPETVIRAACVRTAEAMEVPLKRRERWCGRRVRVVDGTTVSMPDTPENQCEYPQPPGQKRRCGFPVMRVVALFSLASGGLLDAAFGSLGVGEQGLFQRLWNRLGPGDVLLGDRAFGSYAQIALLKGLRVDGVFRLHQRRTPDFRTGRRLGRRDHIVRWTKGNARPAWLSPELLALVPVQLLVREMEIVIPCKGFRTQKLFIVTTLLDAKRFGKSDIGDLYRRRWRVELFLRDIKTTLGADVLRCRTPAMVRRELWMHFTAYNLVRWLMVCAAQENGVDPARISFKGTLDTLRVWAPRIASLAHRPRLVRKMTRLLLHYIAHDLVPHRPHRAEPRARKRRPKNYALLTRPRHLFVDIPHRNRYKNPLS